MKNNYNYIDKDWIAVDVSKEVGTLAVDIVSYFDEFGEDDTVCTLYLNDINIESQVENVALIQNAPAMYRLLAQGADYLPPILREDWLKIQKDLANKLISE